MLETINSVIAAISGVLYQPWFVPLFLVVSGIYFTFRCKFIQIRLFRDACRVIMEKPESEGSISSFGALMISTASRVGTGNIIGVSTAICLGGPGAIFWLLLFVGIPLPGTGAWTGTLAASILDMDFKSTTIAVMLGVLLAGVIMMVVSFLGFSLI